MSILSDAQCPAREACWFPEVQRVPDLPHPQSFLVARWAEFPLTAHAARLPESQEGGKNDSTFLFIIYFQIKNCCPGVFSFFDMAEFNLDLKKNIL